MIVPFPWYSQLYFVLFQEMLFVMPQGLVIMVMTVMVIQSGTCVLMLIYLE